MSKGCRADGWLGPGRSARPGKQAYDDGHVRDSSARAGDVSARPRPGRSQPQRRLAGAADTKGCHGLVVAGAGPDRRGGGHCRAGPAAQRLGSDSARRCRPRRLTDPRRAGLPPRSRARARALPSAAGLLRRDQLLTRRGQGQRPPHRLAVGGPGGVHRLGGHRRRQGRCARPAVGRRRRAGRHPRPDRRSRRHRHRASGRTSGPHRYHPRGREPAQRRHRAGDLPGGSRRSGQRGGGPVQHRLAARGSRRRRSGHRPWSPRTPSR